jgi:hypothetical protein
MALGTSAVSGKDFHQMNVLFSQEFDLVDWEMIYLKLREVPKMFQLWACKQVMGIASTMEWDKTVVRKCRSCLQEHDTCAHILFCCHEGRVETLHLTLDLLEDWLVDTETEPDFWIASWNTLTVTAGTL